MLPDLYRREGLRASGRTVVGVFMRTSPRKSCFSV
jgi:hypothetical protein